MRAESTLTAAPDALDVAAGAFIDELARSGVRNACVCPGSRSTPLAMLLDAHAHIRVWMHLDERSAAYFALGMAKASGEPVALLATSGTATLNFAPAVAEAHHARVPLIVLTADRPPELRDVGAPQTIDQSHLYGPRAKWFVEMPLPEATDAAARHWRLAAARACATAIAAPRGPAHLNFPLREPLIPAMRDVPHSGGAPAARVTTAPRRAAHEFLAALAAELHGIARGIIVCGPQDDDALPAAAAALGRALGYPVLADPLSGVRCGEHDRSLIISAYDAFLRDAEMAAALCPDAVLRFGAQPTSKPLVQLLRACDGARQVIVDAEDGWAEPLPPGTEIVRADPTSFCEDLASAADDAHSDWALSWMSCETSARAAIASHFADHAEISEPAVIADLASVLPDGATLFAGNSMPVRDLDSFFPAGEHRIRFMANRGVNGIDGVVSSAIGASTVVAPLVLVIGDLSFYHDMNGLLAAKQHGLAATIVLVNNDGGGIFSFLPQAQHPERFEALFGTPHGLDFSAAAAVYGLEFVRAGTRAEFRAAVARSIASPGVQIIEVRTDRAENVGVHREIWRRVAAERPR